MIPEKQMIQVESPFDPPINIPFIDYWKLYINFGYFLLLVPFRLRRNNWGKLEISTNRIQKIMCAIVQLTILLQFLSMIWWNSFQRDNKDQLNYFQSFNYACFVAYNLSLNVTFWSKKDAFCKVLDQIQCLRFYDQKKDKRTVLWINFIAFAISVTALVMGLTDIYLVNTFYTHKSLTTFYNELQQRGQANFPFLNVSIDNLPGSCIVTLLTVLQIIILIPSIVFVPYLDLFVLLVPICARRIMKEFRQFYKNTKGSPGASERILRKYVTLRKFMKHLNRAMGIMICACVCVSLPYYAAWIGVSFFDSDNVHPVTLFHLYAFFSIFFLALSLAADINKQGIDFYCWISRVENEKCDQISSQTISSLLVDMHSNQIALKGSSFFVITFRFLGTIVSIIATYSIITIQIQITRHASGFHRSRSDFILHGCNCNISTGGTGVVYNDE